MSEAVISIAQRIRARDEAAAASFGSGPVPEQAARANTLSRDLDLPTDFVDRNMGAVEQIALQRKAQDAITKHPVIGDWASDPRNAAIGKDDIDNLSLTAKLLSGAADVGRNAGGALAAGITTDISSGLWGLARGVVENLTESPTTEIARQNGGSIFDPLIGFLAEQQKSGQRYSEAIAGPDPKGFVARNLKAGLRSAPLSAVALGVTAATGNPALGAGVVSAQVGGQAYGQARDKGLTPGRAAIFAGSQGVIEYATEKVPALKYLEDLTAGSSFTRTLVNNFLKELPQEQAATVLQDFNEWAALTPERPFMDYIRERPQAGLATAIATFAGTAASVTAAQGPRILVERERKKQAEADAAFLESLATGSTESKVRTRDPSAFAKFIELQAQGSPVENLYVPGEKLAEYFQSQGMDWHDGSTWDFDSSVPTQLDEALATGGDVVIKTSDFAAHVAGTPAWEALKNEVRLSPGGLSLNEAQAYNEDEALGKLGEDFAGQLEKDYAENEPRLKLYQSVRDKLTNAGFTQNAADAQAQLLTARAETRATRKGQKLTGAEYDTLAVNQVLPERLAPVVAADGLDMVIAALKGSGKPSTGPSLLEFVAKAGGVEDRGGDIASMGGDKWHREKGFRKKLIKQVDNDPSFLPGQKHANSLDDMAQRAWEAGYLPEFTERPTTAQFLEVMGEELRGRPRHLAADASQTDDMRAASQDLADLLAQEGVDFHKASPKEIKDTVARYQAAREGGESFDQEAPVKALVGDEIASLDVHGGDLRRAAREWFASNLVGIAVRSGALGRDVQFLGSKKPISASADERKLRIFAALPDLVAKGAIIDTVADTRGVRQIKAWHYLRGNVDLAGENVTVTLSIREEANGDFYYNHVLEESPAPQRTNPSREEGGGSEGGAYDQSIPGKADNINMQLSASFADGPRGKISFDEGRAIIDLFQARDQSTFLHETGHLFLEELKADALSADAPNQLKADWQAVQDWFAANGHPVGGDVGNVQRDLLKQARKILRDRGVDEALVNDVLLVGSQAKGTAHKNSDFDFVVRIDPSLAATEQVETWDALTKHFDQMKTVRVDGADRKVDVFVTDEVYEGQSARGIADGVIPVEAHELWARGIERYLMEGKAPNTGLRKIFDMFRSWLLNIYQVVDNLRSPITPEIRDVMDRLIATDEEISQAREQRNIKALFTDAAQAGMTEAEFAAYQKSTLEARDEAFDQLLYKTMQAIRQSRTKAYKDEEATVRAEVTDRVNARPEWRAMDAIKAGQRLSRQSLVDTYGEDALRLLPARVPPVYSDKGVNADELAELSGFRTGDEMVRTLMGIQERTRQLREGGDQRSVRKVMIDEETQAVMRERHGDPLTDGSIEEEALAVIHNEKQGEVIASELRQLGRQSNNQPTPYRIAREWASRKIAESKVVEATSGSALQRYARAASKAAKAAEEAMLKGDADETFRQKQAQMLNNALIAEAKKAKDRIDIAVARMGRIAKRATMKSVDQDYLDQAHALLEQVNFRTVSQRQVDRQESFQEWAQAREAEGFDVVVPDNFVKILGTTNWSRLTVENLFGLDDAVQQIMHLGRFKQKLIDGKEQREREAVIAEAQDAIGQLPPKPPSDLYDPSWIDRFKSGVAGFDASLLKLETIFDWLDGNKSDGVFNRIVFRPIAEAQDRQNDMIADYHDRIRKAFEKVGAKQVKRWQGTFSDPALINRETGNPYQYKRANLIALALNMGNEGNVQRVTDGYGWNEQAVRDVLNRELTQEDWAVVQDIWDIIDTLWPQIEAMEKRINGVAPDKVESSPFETPFGTMRGGYYPAIYDSRRSVEAERQQGKASDLLETIYTRATTRASATKARAQQVKRPILLDLGVINRHLGEVIHDITHREAIMQADKFLSEPRIVKAVDETLGPEMRKQFRPWLKYVANQWAMERAGNEGVGKFMRKARTNTTIVGMGFRASTIIQQLAGYSNSFEKVGAKWVSEGFASTARHPIDTFNFVMERSGEIRHRMGTLDRDINQSLNALAGKRDLISDAKRFAFHGIGYTDRMVVIPTWMGAYNKALAEGGTETQAIYDADKAVRQSQGAASAKDMAAIQRGTGQYGELLKFVTMFYSYMSAVYQRQRTFARDVRQADRTQIPGLMARAWWLYVVPPLAAAMLSGDRPDDDEDESWGAWAFKNMLFHALGPIPGVRDFARPVWARITDQRSFGAEISPVARAYSMIEAAIGDAVKLAKGDDTKRATRDIMEAAGYTTGLIPGQIAAATQFLVDVGYGEQDPETVGDWYEGLTKGKVKD